MSQSDTFAIPRTPADKTAALVTGPAAELGRFENRAQTGRHQEQFADLIKSALANPTRKVPHHAKNYRGVKNGRITIVTYSHSRKPNNPKRDRMHYWVGRCDCGGYEIRTARSLGRKEADHASDMCEQCKRMECLRQIASGERQAR